MRRGTLSRFYPYTLFLLPSILMSFSFFFFNATATTEIYTLSLHDALPIFIGMVLSADPDRDPSTLAMVGASAAHCQCRSEEHTSELQSHSDLVCRLLLEKKNKARDRAITLPTRSTRVCYLR